MTIRQLFCSVNELIADQDALGGDEARLFRAIQMASDYLQKKVGEFIPVQETLALDGKGGKMLITPPLLSLTSISNDGIALTANDYLLEPVGRFWRNGPYVRISVASYPTHLATWSVLKAGIQIAGNWGLYERSALTGATIGTGGQSDIATTLLIDDGSKVSAGDQLLIETEQQLVTGRSSPTAAVTTLAVAASANDETLTLADGTKIKAGEMIRIDTEKLLVLDINGNVAAVRRGWNKTTRAAHLVGASVDAYRTFTVERAVNGTTAAAHLAAIAISRYEVPETISTLTREIATLGLEKAKSAYQGRTGSQELGTVFYHDIFPRFDLDQIQSTFYIPRMR